MRIIPRLSTGCLIPLAFILLIFLLEESQFGLVQARFARSNFSNLEKRIEADGQVRLADLQDDWDLVCLATPYCMGNRSIAGAPEAIQKACNTTGDDSSYALAYFKRRELTHIEALVTAKDINISKPCLLLSDDPVIFDSGVEFKIRPRAAP